MKAVRLHAYGGVDQFKLEDVPVPIARAGEVVIRVAMSGLNPVDLYVRQGFTAQLFPMELPGIIGVDAAGTVTSLGSGVSGFAVGDRVIAHLPINGKGAHAEFAVVPVAGLARLPANVSFADGATLPLAGLTGREAVDALAVKLGDRVLVSGALGAVGRAAVQYLKELGAQPVAGVRANRLAEAEALFGKAVDIDRAPDSPGFDYAVSAAGPVAANVVRFVKDGGKVASLVQTPKEANPGGRVTIIQIMAHDDPALLQKIADAAGRGELTIPIAQTFPLSELAKAHQALAGNPRGKIVVRH
jgi:NADPH:quinone reductase-like Zn-dependent oxidoreductase